MRLLLWRRSEGLEGQWGRSLNDPSNAILDGPSISAESEAHAALRAATDLVGDDIDDMNVSQACGLSWGLGTSG